MNRRARVQTNSAFKCVIKSGESFVEVINIARKLPYATLYTVVDAAHNVLECLLIGIVFYFDLRRSGFDGIGGRLMACLFAYFGSLAGPVAHTIWNNAASKGAHPGLFSAATHVAGQTPWRAH